MTTAPNRSRKNAAYSESGGEDFPRSFGNYLLLMPFARGGMGEVYLAKHGVIAGAEKYCVLKKLRPELTEDREYVARFIDEARVVVQLNHANICQVFDVGRVGYEYYLAMEYVSGRDVRSIQDRARNLGVDVTEAAVLYLLAETLSALDYAHRRTHPVTGEPLNLVHRDVSPQNVMVSFEGEVKLIDFGLASSRLKVERTQPNVVMGKMAYMAPEQARGDGIDKRADLFAAAVVGYELMAGERFYEGMSSQEIWYVVGRGGFVPQRWTELNPDFARILAKALHPEPESRYETCAEFRDNLMAYLHTRHPGLGERSLRELVHSLYVEEIQRERDMLLGFAEISCDVVRDVNENTRSQSVSLAHAGDVSLDPKTGGEARVVHDERTAASRDSAPSYSPRTQIIPAFPDTGSEEIAEEHTMLEQVLAPPSSVEHDDDLKEPTPPTGTIASRLGTDEYPATSLGSEPDDATHLATGASVEQTAMVTRTPAPTGAAMGLSVEEPRPSRGRGALLAAGLTLIVGVAGATLLLSDGEQSAEASAAEPALAQADAPAEAPLKDPAGEDATLTAAAAEAAPEAPLKPPPEDALEAPVTAQSDAPLEAASEAAAAAASVEEGAEPTARVSEAKERAIDRARQRREKRARDEERAARERKERENKRAAAAAAAAAAAEREKRHAAPRAQQPRESFEHTLRTVLTCSPPPPCKAQVAQSFVKYKGMGESEKRAFEKHVRECRKQCSK